MSMNLTDQTVLVTGGARGLGRALTDAFLREGATVIVNYFSSGDAAASLMAEHPGRVLAVQADVRDREQVDALFTTAAEASLGPVTTVVNNALVDFSFNGDARPTSPGVTSTASSRERWVVR
jgi:3-oxoacyl-[acyl-carrier protein] reductase